MAARINKTEITESWKQKISVSMLMNRLKDHADGKIELQQTQLKAIELILQRTVPSLSAVEQTTIEPDQKLSEADILGKITALLAAHPDLVQQALAMQARSTAATGQLLKDSSEKVV